MTYKVEVENQIERKLNGLWSDCGGEYFKIIFRILHGTYNYSLKTPPYAPEPNGIAERNMCTLTKLVNTML